MRLYGREVNTPVGVGAVPQTRNGLFWDRCLGMAAVERAELW